MSKIFLIFLSVVSFGSAVHAQSDASGSKPGAKIVAVVERLARAGIERDVRAVDEIYAEGYFHTNADGSMMSKADVLDSYRAPAGSVKIESNTHDEDKIRISGDTAVFSTRVAYKGVADGRSFTRFYRVTYVLKKKKRWQIIASHASIMTN
ncbi:MAG TPA: nuclear transport factor 2 family protein [Pyrinomonadaceae bacterium]|jgi:ketosteroid isomerase-like protein